MIRSPGWDLIDRAGAILEQSVGFRPAALEILGHVASSVVVDLYFEPGKTALHAGLLATAAPSASARCLSMPGKLDSGSRKRMNTPLLQLA
jgi:hypothetical protein